MNTHVDASGDLSDAALAAELASLGAAFVVFSEADRPVPSPTPRALLVALAQSDSARLRMALIPLLIARPDYAQAAIAAAPSLAGRARVTFTCYYTAAMFLQRKHAARLAELGFRSSGLPDLFSRELDLPHADDADQALALLAERHAERSGRALNWRGTYEQAARPLFRQLEREAA